MPSANPIPYFMIRPPGKALLFGVRESLIAFTAKFDRLNRALVAYQSTNRSPPQAVEALNDLRKTASQVCQMVGSMVFGSEQIPLDILRLVDVFDETPLDREEINAGLQTIPKGADGVITDCTNTRELLKTLKRRVTTNAQEIRVILSTRNPNDAPRFFTPENLQALTDFTEEIEVCRTRLKDNADYYKGMAVAPPRAYIIPTGEERKAIRKSWRSYRVDIAGADTGLGTAWGLVRGPAQQRV